MSAIHPTALISKGAQLGPGVEIGPYTVVGPHVSIGAGTRIAGHVTLEGRTRIGERCQVYSGAVIGGDPQDIRFKPSIQSGVVIGHDNILREHITIHRGSKDGSDTILGDRNFIMIGVHIAHDGQLGNDIIIGPASILGGHVSIEDKAVLSGMVGLHQFVRVGRFCMIGGICKVIKDILPYALYAGAPAQFHGINAVGLKRAGFTSRQRLDLKEAYRMLFREGALLKEAVHDVRQKFANDPDVQHILNFIESSKRGICRPRADYRDMENAVVE